MPMKSLLIALPDYQLGHNFGELARTYVYMSHRDWKIYHINLIGSLLAYSFNNCWCTALNQRLKEPLDYFLMMHSDVYPERPDWFDVMVAEMERCQADILSVAIPIKDDRGLTSIALDTDPWEPARLTQKQVRENYPITFTAPNLLVNTGLMLVKMRDDWVEKICFTIRDKIERQPNGEYKAFCQPEDWDFSRQARALGRRIFATSAVTVRHYGVTAWHSDKIWGWETDTQNGEN